MRGVGAVQGREKNQLWPEAYKGAQLARLDTFEMIELQLSPATQAHESQWRWIEMTLVKRSNYSCLIGSIGPDEDITELQPL